MGLCLPSECKKNDLKTIMEKYVPDVVTLKSLRQVPNPNYNFYLEPMAIILA